MTPQQDLPPPSTEPLARAYEAHRPPGRHREPTSVCAMRPPSLRGATWPPLRVYCLGAFQIDKNETSLRFAGKAPRKPLALLKALVALGGSAVHEDALIDIVWPEGLDGDGQKAFDITLHRLRKLLGHDKAVLVDNRRVSFNGALVWVDLWELERRLAALVPLAPAMLPAPDELERAAPAILALYRGHFLEGEAEACWLLPVRNRLDGRFQRFVVRLGEHWENASQWSKAAQLYERVIELDPLAEAFYARQMQCLAAQGRGGEAIALYRRLRRMLSVTLGVRPGDATEAVYRNQYAG